MLSGEDSGQSPILAQEVLQLEVTKRPQPSNMTITLFDSPRHYPNRSERRNGVSHRLSWHHLPYLCLLDLAPAMGPFFV